MIHEFIDSLIDSVHVKADRNGASLPAWLHFCDNGDVIKSPVNIYLM